MPIEKYICVTRALQKGFEVTSEGDTLTLKKNSPNIRFDKKVANNGGEGFLITSKFYKIENDATLFFTHM